MSEFEYLIWFSSINILPIKKYRLFKAFENIKDLFLADEFSLLKVDDINLLDISIINESKNLDLIKKYELYINKNNIKLISISDDAYPNELKNIYDPPIALYAKGNLNLLKNKKVAIVGSRDADDYGKSKSYKFGYEFAKNGYTVVSGLAKGIDAMAHMGALKYDGNTIAVIGSGLDICYPMENIEIYKKLFQKSLIISEYIVGTKPLKENFPMRNRIISGLSEKVIVVEAREKSGAMITVDLALEQGKDVYAVPRKY